MSKRGPLAVARRFAMSVPGQILVNTAAFTLPEELRIGSSWKLLDVGCGRASMVRVLADRVNLLNAPVAMDASSGTLALARRDMAVEGGPRVSLAQGAAMALPFADETFDLLLSAHGFKELTDDELRGCLSEASRVLKRGALFLAWEFAPTASPVLDRWNHWVLTREAPLVRLRSYPELRALAYECGFDWVERAHLRPFLFPPIPRVSLIMSKALAGWRRTVVDGRVVLQRADEEG